MNQAPRRILRQLMAQHGSALCRDPDRTEAYLCDLCGKQRREIFVLVNAQRDGVPAALLTTSGGRAHWQRLSQRLQRRYAFTAEAADWAVETWALALGTAPLESQRPAPLAALIRFVRRRRQRASSPSRGIASAPARGRGKNSPVGVQLGREDARRLPGLRVLLLAGVVVALMGTVISLARPARQSLADSLAFWRQDAPGAGWEAPSRAQAVAALRQIYPPPREARIEADLLNVRQEPSLEGRIIGYVGPKEALVTVDQYAADGDWAHISSPVEGWISHEYLTFVGEADGLRVRLTPRVGWVMRAGSPVYNRPEVEAAVVETLVAGQTVWVIAISRDGMWLHVTYPARGWVGAEDVSFR